MIVRRAALVGLLAALPLAAGCVSVDQRDGLLVYTFAWWVGALAIAGGLAFVPFAILLPWTRKTISTRARRGRIGAGASCAILALVLLALVAPSAFVDEVVVADDGFSTRSGFCMSPNRHEVFFAKLREIRYTTEKHSSYRRGHRRTSTKHYLDCVLASGSHEKIVVGVVLDEAMPEIAARAEAAGVKLADLPDE